METLLDKTGTLRAQEHGHQPIVLLLYENHGQDSRITGPLEIAPTVAQKFGTGGNNTPLVLAFKTGAEAEAGRMGVRKEKPSPLSAGESETSRTPAVLTAAEDGTYLLDGRPCAVVMVDIRRLTPVECERLQGFPDGWTDIGPWKDSKGKTHKESSDSARYKALGNSIALPYWKWLCKRISAQYERDATMASLFDGIGGFPLAWEAVNGKGSCLWASEIEEFPMAVTKFHFGEEGRV